MSWVSEVHGSLYNDHIGYYKEHEDVSDFEPDEDVAYDVGRKKYIKKAAKRGYYQTHDIARPSKDVLRYHYIHRKHKTRIVTTDQQQQQYDPMYDQLQQQQQRQLQKRLTFSDVPILKQRDFESVMKLATVVSVGALSLVGAKLVMDFIVKLSKE